MARGAILFADNLWDLGVLGMACLRPFCRRGITGKTGVLPPDYRPEVTVVSPRGRITGNWSGYKVDPWWFFLSHGGHAWSPNVFQNMLTRQGFCLASPNFILFQHKKQWQRNQTNSNTPRFLNIHCQPYITMNWAFSKIVAVLISIYTESQQKSCLNWFHNQGTLSTINTKMR